MQRMETRHRPANRDIGRAESTTPNKGSMGVAELVFIGVGGIIGAGFFLGAGLPIRTAGPSVLIAFVLGAIVTAQVIGALSTLAVADPQKGSFVAHSRKYLGEYAGFLQGWTYYITSVLTISSEAVAMSIFTRMWLPHVATWITASLYALVIVAINAFGIKNFGRIESLMSVLKIAALVGFIVFIGYLLIFGAGRGALAAQGSFVRGGSFFPHGATGMFQSMLIVIFAYAGIGVFATAAPEMKNPKGIDKAAWITVITLAVLYIASIALLITVMPWRAMSTTSSPFVDALRHTGVPILGEILNGIILVASFSVMAGAVFSANQILENLGESRDAPRFVSRVSANGTSYWSLLVTTVGIGVTIAVSYMLPSNVYNFLISASSFLTFLYWFVILWTFLSWRKKNGRKQLRVSSLAFGQPVMPILTMAFVVFLTVYAFLQKDQRLGFYAFVALAIVISLLYAVTSAKRGRREQA